jgi:hypothetical protein
MPPVLSPHCWLHTWTAPIRHEAVQNALLLKQHVTRNRRLRQHKKSRHLHLSAVNDIQSQQKLPGLVQHLILRSDLQGKLFHSNRQPAHQRVSRSAVHAVRNKRHSGTHLPRAIYLCLNKKRQCQLLHAVVSRRQGSRHSKDKCASNTSMKP